MNLSFHNYVVENERKEFKNGKQHLTTRKIIAACPESSNKNMKRSHRTVIDNYKDNFKKILKGNGGMHQVTVQSYIMLSLDHLNRDRMTSSKMGCTGELVHHEMPEKYTLRKCCCPHKKTKYHFPVITT